MPQVTYSFEGGTSGNSVAAGAGAGSGDTNFDVVNIGTNATDIYDNAQFAHGGLGNKIAIGATSTTVYNSWTTAIGTQATVWIRLYLYFTAVAAVNHRIFGFVGAAASRGSIEFTTSGTLQFRNSTGSSILTSAAVPLNSWFRLEAKFIGDATVGQWEYKIWRIPDSTAAPDDTQTSAATINTGGTCDTYRFGCSAAVANIGPYWQDDVGVSTFGYMGPVNPFSIVHHGTNSGSSITMSVTITTPTLGNLLIVCPFGFAQDIDTTTLPVGWNERIVQEINAPDTWLFWKISDGTETSFSVNGVSTTAFSCSYVEVAGFTGGNPTIDQYSWNESNNVGVTSVLNQVSAKGTSIGATLLTLFPSEFAFTAFVWNAGSAGSFTTPSGWTLIDANTTQTQASSATYWKYVPFIGTDITATGQFSVTNTAAGQVSSFRAASHRRTRFPLPWELIP